MLCALPANDPSCRGVRVSGLLLVLEIHHEKELGFYLRPGTKSTAELENVQSERSISMVLFPPQKIHGVALRTVSLQHAVVRFIFTGPLVTLAVCHRLSSPLLVLIYLF